MADPRFFQKSNSFDLNDLCKKVGASILNSSEEDLEINDVSDLERASKTDLSFFDNVRYRDSFYKTKAGACFTHKDEAEKAIKFWEGTNENGPVLLVHDNPYKAYAQIAQIFYPKPLLDEHISDKAHIAEGVEIGKGSRIEPFVMVDKGAKIGQGVHIQSGAYIGPNVEIGDYCTIGMNASIQYALIADHVNIYPGVRIGQDGFGFAIDRSGFVKVPQLGRVIIGSHVEIGANTAIDRGAGPDTVIGQGTWIDNLVQIGHNVKIGKGCVIVSQVGVSGSTIIEDYVMIGGQAGFAGHLRIGSGAKIGAQSGVIRDIPAGEEHMGSPSMPIKQYMRQVATLSRLIKPKKSS